MSGTKYDVEMYQTIQSIKCILLFPSIIFSGNQVIKDASEYDASAVHCIVHTLQIHAYVMCNVRLSRERRSKSSSVN